MRYVGEGEDEHDRKFTEFTVDAAGNRLQYIILVHNNRVKSVLYNYRGKCVHLCFDEVSYNDNEFVNIAALGLNYEGKRVTYARLTHIPRRLITTGSESAPLDKTVAKAASIILAPPREECKARHTADLPGLVEVELMPETEERPNPQALATVPICGCAKLASNEERHAARSIVGGWEGARDTAIQLEIESIDSYISEEVGKKEFSVDQLKYLDNALERLTNMRQRPGVEKITLVVRGDVTTRLG